jgi:hypothetical protein
LALFYGAKGECLWGTGRVTRNQRHFDEIHGQLVPEWGTLPVDDSWLQKWVSGYPKNQVTLTHIKCLCAHNEQSDKMKKSFDAYHLTDYDKA